jgi:hypothetical protein
VAWRRHGGARNADISAKRRQTTRLGSSGSPDRGTDELRNAVRRPLRIEATAAGVLYGRGYISAMQFQLMKNMLTHHAIGPVCRTDTG